MIQKLIDNKNTVLLFVIILLVIIPIMTVMSFIFQPSTELWGHLSDNLLIDYLLNTGMIVISVALLTIIIGVSCAWLVTNFTFPGVNVFKWLLVMPIAIPTYVSAYIYAGLFEPSGMIFDSVENYLGLGKELYDLIELRNVYGVIFILSVCLYPYVYLLSYSSFKEQSYCAIEVGKSLGLSDKELFSRVSIPLARPGIIAGVSLVVMETLAEFGTMDYYGVRTFTTGIYRTWFAFGDETSALHLASILLTFVFIIIIVEKFSRGKSQYVNTSQKSKKIKARDLNGIYGVYACLWCLLFTLLGFILPVIQLLFWLSETYSYIFEDYYIQVIKNTVSIATIASIIIVLISIYSSYINRSTDNLYIKSSLKIFTLGYSIPGVVIAVGIIIPLTMVDNFQARIFGSPLYYLSGSFFALVLCYLVRFSTISYNATESGLGKIKKNIDLTVQSFGLSDYSILKKVHMPIMKTTLITSFILVFVDIVKELPATLILRPFNFDTLAINIYELASSEQLSYIASPSLILIIISLIPVILLIRKNINFDDKNEIRN
jgi:iron(III) transport system permease protein|tara:strand:+ start:424 stop:2061 length:1638 start_codon:yes stop_codon:yes gene_type:complete